MNLRHLPWATTGVASAASACTPGFEAASSVPCADATGEVACFEVAPMG